MKVLLVFFASVLVSCVCVNASDMALYAGHTNPGWYVEDTMLNDVSKIKAGVKGLKEVVSFKDDGGSLRDFQTWVEKNLSDKEMDIIWLNGCMPSILYPNPNEMPDESLAEEWLNNGNMFINVADWFAYSTYETGVRGAENGPAGAENILNLTGIIGFFDNTTMIKTDAGEKYMPSLPDRIISDRPVKYSAVKFPWEITTTEIFGYVPNIEPRIYAYAMDPCVIHNKITDGYVAFINQAYKEHSVDRAQATIEFINNWVATEVGFSVFDDTPPVGSIIINNGAKYTDTTTVTLKLEAYDDKSEAIFVDIYGDVKRSFWIDIWPHGENVVEWQRELTTGDGEKTVYAVFKDEAGNASSPVFDTIILDETQPTSVITRPKENETISGIYEIKGTAYDLNSQYYRLEFGVGSSPPAWYDIGVNPRYRNVISGLLGTWDTNDLVDGEYTIRLTVRDQMGKEMVDSVVVNVGNEVAEFPNEYTEDFDTGETGRFYIQQWDGGPVGDVVFDMCRICDEFGDPDLCETCEEFVKVVQLKPERGAGITMRFPEEETGVKFSGDVVIVQTWLLSDNVEIGILITDKPVIDGEDPRGYETFGFLVVQEDGRWVFTEYANGTPRFGEDFGFPVEVWPGDTNDDGLIDGRDVLSIGRYWNTAGPSREYGSCDWEGQMASKWWITEAGTHADANGDGIVDGRDVLCIGLNWGRIHKPSNYGRSEPTVSIPFEPQRWYNVALKFEPVGQSEFLCTVYIDGVWQAETMLNVWDMNLSQAFVNLVTYRGPDSDSSGLFDKYRFKSTCVSDDNIRPSGSITINDGDAYTSSPAVTLTLRARDAGSGLAYVYIAGNLNVAPGRQLRRSWPAGVGPLLWNVELTSGDRQKMVYAVFEDRACNRSAVVRDSIRLDTSTRR